MSVIRDIYATLATQIVTVNDITPRVFDLHQLPNQVQRASLPCRLLVPMAPRGEARDFNFIALGRTAMVTWRITDLLLWRAAASGKGLQDIAETLVGYAGAYVEMLRLNRAMGQTMAHITNARFVYGTFEWPDQGGDEYDGVSCELDIEEALSG